MFSIDRVQHLCVRERKRVCCDLLVELIVDLYVQDSIIEVALS